MTLPTSVDAWEIVALSGLCAVASLGIASVIGGTLAWWVCRERAVAPHAAPAPAATGAAKPARNAGLATPEYA